MNKILTAKEWLENEAPDTFFPITSLIDPINLNCMERYANYRNKMLESKILEFRNKVKDFQFLSIYDEDKLLYEYDKYFGIEGKIN